MREKPFQELGVEVIYGAGYVHKFGDFLQVLPSPVCLGIYKLEPLKGAALVVFVAGQETMNRPLEEVEHAAGEARA